MRSSKYRLGNLSNLFKAYYFDTDRYNGTTKETFERKYTVFVERCDQSDIKDYERRKEFSVMLVGAERQYYLENLREKCLGLEELV